MKRSLVKHIGAGAVWIAPEAAGSGYVCSWRDGEAGPLLDQQRVDSEALAAAWGRERTPRVIFESNGSSYWAGDGSAPAGMDGTWSEDSN